MKFDIIIEQAHCGQLDIQQERFFFTYDAHYIANNGAAISVNMPLREEPYSDEVVFPFFENLLPEGKIRTLIAQRLKTPEHHFARFFSALGGDVAGALTMIASDTANQTQTHQTPTPLGQAELGKTLKAIETSPFLTTATTDAPKQRLSLAGAQHKLPVIFSDQTLYLPGTSASTHIVKPPSVAYPGLVENEYVCMKSAKASGLQVPEVQLIPYVSTDQTHLECYLVKRYDRRLNMGKTLRLHQEDLCQVTNTVSAKKYEHDGGPGFQALFEQTRRLTKPAARHQNELVRRLLFNLLIGNHDAHGKNFSFLHQSNHLTLAPAYDLVCTEAYSELDNHFAMPIGGAKRLSELTRDHIALFARETGVNLFRQRQNILDYINQAKAAFLLEAQVLHEEVYPDAQKKLVLIQQIVEKNYLLLKKLFFV